MPSSDTKTPSDRALLREAERKSVLLTRPGFLIRRLHQLHCALFAEETRAFDVTPVQYSMLTALAEAGEMDQKSLALAIGLERTGVADVINRLLDRGLLARRTSPDDGRVKLLTLTRKGRQLVERMEAAVQRAHDRTLAHLPRAERERFMLQMIRLVEANNEIGAAPLQLGPAE